MHTKGKSSHQRNHNLSDVEHATLCSELFSPSPKQHCTLIRMLVNEDSLKGSFFTDTSKNRITKNRLMDCLDKTKGRI